MKHLRLDFGATRGPRVTSQGFLRLDASLGRCGVNRYVQGDGSVRRELRLPEEVFATEAMDSLAGAPLTYLHPPVTDAWLTRKTWRDYQIGFVGDNVQRLDGGLVGGAVTVQDDARVQQALTGKLRELSPGYICRELEMTSGVHELYGAYDCIQRGIVHNHVGFGPPGWGRQGKDVAVRLDGADAGHVGVLRLDQSALGDFLRAKIAVSGMSVLEVARKTGIVDPIKGDPLKFTGSSTETWLLENILDGWTPRPTDAQLEALAKVLVVPMDDLIRLLPEAERRFDGQVSSPKGKRMELKLDGLTVDIPQRDADIVKKSVDSRDAEIAKLKSDKSELQARADGLQEKLAKSEQDLAAAPAKVRAEVEGRVKLEAVATQHGVKLDGLTTDRAIKEAVISKLKPKADLEGKDDAYVNVRFDTAVEDASERGAPASAAPAVAAMQRAAFTAPPAGEARQDADDEEDPEAIRKKNLEKQAQRWQTRA